MRDLVSCYSKQAVRVAGRRSSIIGGGCSISSRTSNGGGVNNMVSDQTTVSCFYRTLLPEMKKELLITITWSKCLVGQGLSITVDDGYDNIAEQPRRRKPITLRRKMGSQSYVCSGGLAVKVYWDISEAKYHSSPEPVDGFYVIVIVDGELGLFLGTPTMITDDLDEEVILNLPTPEFSLVGRRELLIGNNPDNSDLQYDSLCSMTKTKFRDDGDDHEISIRCGMMKDGNNSELLVYLDKKMVVNVKRLQWNFRGNQTIFVDGLPVDMMWDVHNWCFLNKNTINRSGGGISNKAMFLFRTRSGSDNRLLRPDEVTQNVGERSSKQDLKKSSTMDGFSLLLVHVLNNYCTKNICKHQITI
ncbi:hypothetical protein ZOSMA_258G00020 [Zostera marina]|uniref:DUF868 family protein n=1 Tax=Zostera marina TaxID=29655 RepID=A0A0K9PHU8_ZOSMR|nr:hypothetical protein ZOSMA_258G00020 [Zostera marina]